jgi:hypothetical protein
MAVEFPGQMVTHPASTAVLSTTSVNWQYRFVQLDANGELIAPTTEGHVIGVLQNKPTYDGEAGTVMINGITKVQAAGSTIATGDPVGASTNGMAAAPSTDFLSRGRVVRGSSGSTGRILSVQLAAIGTT